jgi:hypothetical protein
MGFVDARVWFTVLAAASRNSVLSWHWMTTRPV